ncbi:MAG: 30S ribosome-binding factor RbfA [Erysipelotrichaceae bacterium]|jgi:ribosome-binding factor A|nr:30S ribosome-binding factor RbfA [Bacillota bacterium]NLP22614.1 30S ribosome-binding factor RbfA [Erysipelotrichaceae bacterium]HCY06282.1 30S ribosome-binding factor RbfA [Erysipelotrichaceae bacterium]
MAKIKQERLNQTILKEITNIIQLKLKDPSVGFVTITDVVVSNDHSYADVYVSFLGKKERNEAGLKALNRAKGFIRTELARSMTTRRVPELTFKLDNTLEKATRLEKIFEEIENS